MNLNLTYPARLWMGLACCGLLLGSCSTSTRFSEIPASQSGIDFANIITDSDSNNIVINEYIYNGGGVGVADFNHDGLMDLFFSGNMVENRLYLNEGELHFKDISSSAGITGRERWSSGVSIVDLNRDGWADVYVCATNRDDDPFRDNQLYIHQGLDEQGLPYFRDMAADYGLNDNSHSTHSAFFDYDNDGDLDVFIIVDEVEATGAQNTFRPKRLDGSAPTTDRLYRNDWSDSLGHPVFTNVSREAGILAEGYSLGVNIVDINRDGWKDIFITNDYVTNDLLYLNQGDGTFVDVAEQLWKHTCHSAMGNDVIDLDHDGLVDIIEVDMMPENNYRKKTMLMSNNYTAYINNDRFGYTYQYVRNVWQHNEGINPETGLPVFSDIGMLAGFAQTDWSWTPSISDFDNDGWRDLLITNGFPKDITDLDFINYHSQVFNLASYGLLQNRIPSVKLQNFAYRNGGNMQFEDKTEDWGLTSVSFSSGAVYVDLDNDGDMDWVVNNINDPAFVYRNDSPQKDGYHWLKVNLKGLPDNPDAYGSWVEIWSAGQHQVWEHTPFRGYLSSVDPRVHFGLGTTTTIDSLRVRRPDGKQKVWKQVAADQWFAVDFNEGNWQTPPADPVPAPKIFTPSTDLLQLQYVDRDSDYVDFNVQRLLPHKLSQYGPGLAVGDVNQDGLEDLYVTGSHFFEGRFFLQQTDGTFALADLIDGPGYGDKQEEELGALLFDADGDGDLDLYLVSGGYEFPAYQAVYQDRLLRNENGRFALAADALPQLKISGSAVKAVDYDHDGDLDLFVGGRVVPEQYPKAENSYLLRNESTAGNPRFVIDEANSQLFQSFGLVCDAIWSDYDQDGWADLLVAAEWMPLRVFHNDHGQLQEVKNTGLESLSGWWNSLAGGDFDRDGDIDYIVGNLGLNSLNKASDQYPLGVYAADFDDNGGYDAIPTVFFEDVGGIKKEFPFLGRLDLEKQLVQVKKQFPYHMNFGRTTIQEFLAMNPVKDLVQLHANYLQSSWVENLGGGKFVMHALPIAAQYAPVYGMVVEDLDEDGYPEVLLVGNDYGTELTVGRYDAANGLLLKNGPEGFVAQRFAETGFYVPGDAKALVSLAGVNGQLQVVASQNMDSLRAFTTNGGKRQVLQAGESLLLTFPDGGQQRIEGYRGSSFLSQSGSTVRIPATVTIQ